MHKIGKSLALSLISLAGAFHLGRWQLRRHLVVLTYHRVLSNHQKTTGSRLPDSLFSGEFEWQISHIVRHYHVATGEEIRAFLTGKSTLPPYSVFITFDDGFENNYTEAFPILQRYGVSAAFFLTTGLIDQPKKILWFDRLDAILSTVLWFDIAHWLASCKAPYHIQDKLQLRHWLKSLSQPDRDRIITQLEGDLGLASCLDAREGTTYKLMTWGQAREMAAQGMTIGSHTVSHQILSSATPEEVQNELVTSRKQIEEEIRHQCWCFSYPNGTAADFRLSDKEAVQSAGYACAFTQISDFINKDTNCYALPRISMSESYEKKIFLSRLTGIHHQLVKWR